MKKTFQVTCERNGIKFPIYTRTRNPRTAAKAFQCVARNMRPETVVTRDPSKHGAASKKVVRTTMDAKTFRAIN